MGIITKPLLLIIFCALSSSGNSQTLPSLFDQPIEELSLYKVKRLYLNQGKSLTVLDSLAEHNSMALQAKNEAIFVLNEIARISLLTDAGNLEESLMQIEKYRDHSALKNHKKLQGYLYNVQGGTYFAMRKAFEARAYYRKAIDVLSDCRDSVAWKGNIVNMGNTYMAASLPDSAMMFYNRAVEFEKAGILEFRFSLQSNIALAFAGQGMNERAAEIYEDLLFEKEELLKPSEFTAGSINLSRYYLSVNRDDEVVSILTKALGVAKSHALLSTMPPILNGLSKAHAQLGNDHLALEALTMKDSVEAILDFRSLEDLNSNIKIKHQAESFKEKTAEKDDTIKDEKEKRVQLQMLFGVLLVVLILLIYLYLKKRKKNRALLKQNLELAKEVNYDRVVSGQKSSNHKTPDELKLKIESALLEKQLFKDPEISLEKMAKKLDTNRSYLSEGINEVFGSSFRTVVNKLRVDESRKMLIDENFMHYSIEGIAQSVGYRNISSFNSAFKKETGLTPSYFRNNHSSIR